MLIPVILGVTLIIFIMLALTPGDPARQILGGEATEEQVEALREEMGQRPPAGALSPLHMGYAPR